MDGGRGGNCKEVKNENIEYHFYTLYCHCYQQSGEQKEQAEVCERIRKEEMGGEGYMS